MTNRVILLFDVLDFEIRGVDFTLIRQSQKEQLLRRERMVSLCCPFTTTVEFVSSNKEGNIVVIERVVCCRCTHEKRREPAVRE